MKLPVRLRHLALSAFLFCASVPAWAQDKGAEKQPPFDVSGLPPERVWLPWIFAFLFLVGCVLIALKNPRRTHLD